MRINKSRDNTAVDTRVSRPKNRAEANIQLGNIERFFGRPYFKSKIRWEYSRYPIIKKSTNAKDGKALSGGTSSWYKSNSSFELIEYTQMLEIMANGNDVPEAFKTKEQKFDDSLL